MPLTVVLLLYLILPGAAFAAPAADSPPFSLRLIRAVDDTPDGPAPMLIAVVEPEAGYYAYAYNSPEGLPLLAGLCADGREIGGGTLYPAPSLREDLMTGREVPAYSGPTPLFLSLPAEGGDGAEENPRLHLSMLLCARERCVPVDTAVDLPGGGEEPTPVGRTAWAPARKGAAPAASARQAALCAASARPERPERPDLAPAPLAFWPAADSEPAESPAVWNFSPRDPSFPLAGGEERGRAASAGMLLWSLAAGLLLNLMPCVLPVVTLKLSTLMGGAADRSRERVRRFREHNLCFAAGVLTWFALAAGAFCLFDLYWGGVFQYPPVVGGLALLTGLLAFSMLDLYTLPLIDLKFAPGRDGHQHPRLQAYVTGLTATLLATPCSGPLLGGVLAWSVMQPADMIFASFLSVGIGMASPYLICALAPGAVRLLPRPGAWLLVLERAVGVFLLGTTVYLLDILPRAWALALAAALLIAALRLILRNKAARTGLIAAACLACVLAGLWLARDRNPAADWETFSPRLLREALGKRLVLLEFTADWCPNCKLLEMGTLAPSRLADWKKRYGLLAVRADMTADEPQRKALLRALGSISIPLTALFAPGEAAARPVLLHGIYSPAELEAALAALNAPNFPNRETAP